VPYSRNNSRLVVITPNITIRPPPPPPLKGISTNSRNSTNSSNITNLNYTPLAGTYNTTKLRVYVHGAGFLPIVFDENETPNSRVAGCQFSHPPAQILASKPPPPAPPPAFPPYQAGPCDDWYCGYTLFTTPWAVKCFTTPRNANGGPSPCSGCNQCVWRPPPPPPPRFVVEPEIVRTRFIAVTSTLGYCALTENALSSLIDGPEWNLEILQDGFTVVPTRNATPLKFSLYDPNTLRIGSLEPAFGLIGMATQVTVRGSGFHQADPNELGCLMLDALLPHRWDFVGELVNATRVDEPTPKS
jgi:hypothetical protein